jgi:hypothetical protein
MSPAPPPPTNADYLLMTDPDTTPPETTNWVTLGGGAAFVGGNNGQYKHEQGTNSGALGGVQDFHWQTFAGKDGVFTMDGHGMFGNHDYDLKLDLTDAKLGYIRAGFTEFRTWYDPTGGFYPVNSLSFQPSDSELFVDRRDAYIELGLTIPDWPVLSARYEYDSREGMMDSTSWGQTTLIPGGAQTKIVPTFLGIDETRHIFSANATDTIGNTDAALGLSYERDDTDDSTFIDQNPSQTTNAFITQQDVEKNDLFSVHGMTSTLFDQKVTLTSGFSATTIESDLGGSRIYGSALNTPLSTTFVNNGSGYINLGGGGNTKDYVGNLNLMLTPIANLVIVPSARVEYESSNLNDGFTDTTGHTPPATGFVSTAEVGNTDNWYLNVAQSVEARYTGFKDWSLYTSAEVSEDWGNEAWAAIPILNGVNMNQDWERLGFKYTAGANWYPLPQLNFGAQYYHEIHDYTFSNNLNPPSTEFSQYPGYLRKQNFTTDDMNIRATWMALSNVSLVTRYDFQFETVDTWGIPSGGTAATQGTQVGGAESANLINHILSEDVTWTPLACLYLQAGGSYVLNTLETPVAGSAGINNLVLNGQNDYWTIDASLGYELNAKTHLQLQYSYYNADDYFNNAPSSLPYGADTQENSFTATVTRDISKEVKVSVKYGFYRNRDDTSGGQNNYDAQVVYFSTQFGF